METLNPNILNIERIKKINHHCRYQDHKHRPFLLHLNPFGLHLALGDSYHKHLQLNHRQSPSGLRLVPSGSYPNKKKCNLFNLLSSFLNYFILQLLRAAGRKMQSALCTLNTYVAIRYSISVNIVITSISRTVSINVALIWIGIVSTVILNRG